jgi:hypothetical protein
MARVRDAQIFYAVVPAKAGIHFCVRQQPVDSRFRGNDETVTNATGASLKPALECLNRGGDDASWYEPGSTVNDV